MKWTRCPKEHLALLFFVFIRFLPLFVIYLRLFSAPFRFRVCRFFITAGALDHFPNDVLIAQHRIFFSTRPFTLFRYRFFFLLLSNHWASVFVRQLIITYFSKIYLYTWWSWFINMNLRLVPWKFTVLIFLSVSENLRLSQENSVCPIKSQLILKKHSSSRCIRVHIKKITVQVRVTCLFACQVISNLKS